MAEQKPPLPRKFRRGFAMICAGLLVLVPSGLCTGYFGIFSFAGMVGGSASRSAANYFWLALMLGAPPILMGIALIWVGLRLNRS